MGKDLNPSALKQALFISDLFGAMCPSGSLTVIYVILMIAGSFLYSFTFVMTRSFDCSLTEPKVPPYCYI